MTTMRKLAVVGVTAMLFVGVAWAANVVVKYSGPAGQGDIIYWAPSTATTNLRMGVSGATLYSPTLVGGTYAPTTITSGLFTGVTISNSTVKNCATDIAVADGGTGASTATAARSNLGLGSMAVQGSNAVIITGGSVAGITDLAVGDGGTGASTAANARSNLGVGSLGMQASNAVNIIGGTISGITDLAVADGGTGASSASAARSNLGVGSLGMQASNAVDIIGGKIAGITDLAVADGGTGASDASTARTNLGLGSVATQNVNAVEITGGTITVPYLAVTPQTITAVGITTQTLTSAVVIYNCASASTNYFTAPANTRTPVTLLNIGAATVAILDTGTCELSADLSLGQNDTVLLLPANSKFYQAAAVVNN